MPAADSRYQNTLENKLEVVTGLENINQNFTKQESNLDQSIFSIKSLLNQKESVVLGTLFNLEALIDKDLLKDRAFLVSKNSMIGNDPLVTLSTGKVVPARVLKRDEENDLILLEIAGKFKHGISLSSVKDSISFNETGKFLISPNPINMGQISVLGNNHITVPGVPNSGFLGITTELKDGALVLTTIQRRSPASMAKLKVGDKLLSINGVNVKQPVELFNEVQKYKPEQRVKVQLKRGEEEFTQDITLASRLNVKTHIADQFTDGKSERRFGFKNVFVHDGKLKPAECGGPVFDLAGAFYGINIARFSRTSSIAIPAKVITTFITQAFLQPV